MNLGNTNLILEDHASLAKLLSLVHKYRASKKKEEKLRVEEEYRTFLASQTPFTIEHFKVFTSNLILDNGKRWKLEHFQEIFLKDFLSGIPECWLVVPEGNAKTTLAAAIALYHIRHRMSANVPVAASSRDQAEILYRQAEGLVMRSPGIKKEYRCQEGYRRIKHLGTGGRIQIFASDDRTGDGVIPTLMICDELHRHRDMSLYRTWVGKLEKRGGQLIAISTAGEPNSEFEIARNRIRNEATEISNAGCFTRAYSPRVVMHEWALKPTMDYKNFALVKQANPLSAITIEALKEKYNSPTMSEAHWQRFVCNIAMQLDRPAISEAEWDRAGTDEEIPLGQPIWLGVDVGWKYDTTALVPFWSPDDSKRLLGPACVLEPPRDGTSLDINLIKQAIIDIDAKNPIEVVVMDVTRAEDLAEWIREEIGADVVERGQSNKFAVDEYNQFMLALRNGLLKHTKDDKLKAHVLNAIAKVLPGGDTRFDRARRANASYRDMRVIDALKAAAMVNATYDAFVSKEKSDMTKQSWRPA